MRRDLRPYAVERLATPEDLTAAALVSDWGLFRALEPEARAAIAPRCQICRVAADNRLFDYGSPSDTTTFYVVLAGSFLIEHPHPQADGTLLFHNYYGPGRVIGEVEVLCRDMVIEMPGGEKTEANITRAQITCVQAGRLLRISPAEAVLAHPQVRLNLARQLCYKLMATGASRNRRVAPRFQVLMYLQARLERGEFKARSGATGARKTGAKATGKSLRASISQKRVQQECSLKKQTVSNIFKRMGTKPGFVYEEGRITIPHARFFENLWEEWSHRPPRKPKATDSKTTESNS